MAVTFTPYLDGEKAHALVLNRPLTEIAAELDLTNIIIDQRNQAVGNINNPLCHLPLKNSLDFKGVGSLTYANSSGNKTHVDRYGRVQYTGVDEPRFEKEGILLEGSSTNLFTYSEYFDNPIWGKINSSISPALATAPDGTVSADVFIPDNGVASYIHANISPAVGDVTLSIFAKKVGNIEELMLLLPEPWFTEVTNPNVNYNLTSKTVIVNSDPFNKITNYNIEELTDNWFRLSVSVITDISALGAPQIRHDNVDANGTTDAFYIWGAQIEELPFASSYIPSTDTFTSRATTGTYYDSAGVLQTAAIDTPRNSFNPADLTAPSYLMLEGASENLFLNSGVGVTQAITVVSGDDYTIHFLEGSGLITLSGANASVISSGLTNSVTFSAATTTLTCTVSGDTNKVQVERKSFASSYIPTIAASVTRAADISTSTVTTRVADSLELDWQGNMPNLNTGGESTTLVDFDTPVASAPFERYVLYHDETSFQYHLLRTSVAQVGEISSYRTGAPQLYNIDNQHNRHAITIDTDDLKVNYLNGVSVSSANVSPLTNGSTQGINVLELGNSLFGHISNFRTYDKALTAQEIALA